jgi:hypothetical protein
LPLGRITKRDKGSVPWLELARKPTKYLDVNTIPEGFKVLDPSKLTKDMVFNLWCHWTARARAKQPILIFNAARKEDLGFRTQRPDLETSVAVGKRKAIAYVDLSSDDQASDNELEDRHTGKGKDWAGKGKGNPGSPATQPPFKRPRLFKRAAIPEEQSPTSNKDNKPNYLRSLSSEDCYRTLLDGVLALPLMVSFSSSV